MSKPSPAQMALLREMAEEPHRHIIDRGTYLDTSWHREPGKRQITDPTVDALERLGLLDPDRYDGMTIWRVSTEGRALAKRTDNKVAVGRFTPDATVMTLEEIARWIDLDSVVTLRPVA